MPTTEATPLTRKDFQSDQEVRWCPGCGDYAILSAVQQVFPELGIPREKFVIVSGIGCSSRFPYYMNTYGFHSIHGRAPAVATGIKMTRPDLDVWVVTGDGDALSIGGNHLIHTLRRNVNVKILLFNNRVYGLTKGQYSPTSELGKRTKSTPHGSVDFPFNPLNIAIGAGATFVARSVDIFMPHLKEVLKRAAAHKGSAFVEVMQNCNIYNDKAFAALTDKTGRQQNGLYLEHGKPLVFGDNQDRGLRFTGTDFEVIELGNGRTADDCLVWDEKHANPSLAFQMASISTGDGLGDFPVPLGVLRAIDAPTYDAGVIDQIGELTTARPQTLDQLIHGTDTWTVDAGGSVHRGAN